MPELPEVEAVCRKLRLVVEGVQIHGVRVSRCATAQVAELVPGRTIERVERRGKHILLRLSGGITVHTHLRMSGNLFYIPDYRFHSHSARVVMELAQGAGIVLEDKRVLARMDALPDAVIDARLVRELGPEPLSAEFTEGRFLTAARRSRQPAKLFLMNQRNVAGLGNIYAAEVLYRARVDPRRAMNKVSGRKLRALYGAVVTVLTDAVKSAVAAYSGPGAFHSEENFPMAVYGREGEACLSCCRPVARILQGGRSTYFCPRCQR